MPRTKPLTQVTTQQDNTRNYYKTSNNGLAYSKQAIAATDGCGESQNRFSTSTFGFSQQPYFEPSVWGQRPPPSALIQVTLLTYFCTSCIWVNLTQNVELNYLFEIHNG